MVLNLAYTVVRYSHEITAGGNPYLTGDWLINYEGGYNGRGLFGQMMIWISDAFNMNLLWTTYAAQVLLYFIYFPLVISIFRRVENPFAWMIGLSPFFIMFDFLDTGGAFRKELLGFASLSLIVHLIVRGTFRLTSLFLSTFLFIVFLFSWDTAFCFIPLFIYLFSILRAEQVLSDRFFRILSIAYIFLGVGSIVRALYFLLNRTPSITTGICDSLTSRGISSKICGGTITSLTEHSAGSIEMLKTLFLNYNYGFYFAFLLLGLLPFVLNGWIKKQLRIILILFLSIFPLFIVGEDYGRWIHIFGTFVTLVWLVDQRKTFISSLQLRAKTLAARGSLQFLLLSVIFTTAWRIPVAWGSPQDSLLGVAGRIFSWLSH